MSIAGDLQDEMKKAMKAQDAPRLSAIRMLISAIRYAGIDFGVKKTKQKNKMLQERLLLA